VTFNYSDLDAGASTYSNAGTATVGFKDTGTQGTRRVLVSFNSTTSGFVGTGQAILIVPDSTPPTVNVSSPTEGATVNGTINVSANASDNIAVAGVQFLLDGANLGAEDTTAPYSISWDTSVVSAGSHLLTARARDTSGNVATSAVHTVTVVPRLTITAPASGASVSGPTVSITYATSGDLVGAGVHHVHFTLDGVTTLMDFTVDGSFQFPNVTPGNHVLTAVLVRADHSGIVGTEAGPVSFTVTAPDTTPPSVSLTSPPDGAVVTGQVTVSADASDNVGVAGVQFLLDGQPLGAEDTVAPYSISWDTTIVASGLHTLSARARDAAGNTGEATPRTVEVANSSDPAVVGQWSAVMNWPLVAITSVLLKDGRVLMWDGGPNCLGSSSAQVWDPATNSFTAVPIPYFTGRDDDIWCAGQALLADGRVLVVGGHDCDGPEIGIRMVNIFDPVTMTWSRGPDMAYRRWYPTATTLADGRVLVTAGSVNTTIDYVPIPEVYDPVTNSWTTLTAANRTIPNYAFMFGLPDGRVVAAGSDEAKMATSVLDVSSQTWTTLDPAVLDAGSAVMYRPGMIMKAGSSYLSPPADNGGGVPSAATTYVLDATQATPAWQQTQSMASPRTHLNLTVLADGNVLATGGSTDIGGVNTANAVYTAELWSASTQTWTTMSAAQRPRLYHSTAVLLPDGRVLSAGGGRNFANNHAELNAELYSPPYLFKGARPTITSSPGTVEYRSSFFVATPNAAEIASVALIRNGSVTHSFNMDQRYVPLSFQVGAGGLTVQAPSDAHTAPPGHYMLFIVNSNGVPSIAPIVNLPADTEDPSAPANLTASGGVATALLSWNASTDNKFVRRYNVHRGTTPGFVVSASNRIAQPTANTFQDTGLPAGTYYYKVTAEDGAGNVSQPSAEATAVVTSVQLVQKAATGFEWSVPQISLAFPSNNTAGNLLIVTGTAARPSQAITISDTRGNTYLPAIGPVTDPAQSVTAYIWYVPSAIAGPNTVTLTPDGGGSHAMEIHITEWSGLDKTSPLDQTSWATGFGTLASSGARTTTVNGELVFGYTFLEQSATAGTGFAPLTLVNGDLDEYLIQNTAGSVAATFTQQSDDWLAMMATFKPANLDSQPPSAPTGLTASAASDITIALNWSPSTDNIGVVSYDVYRSTTPGFVPSASNLIGQAVGTTFNDVGLPAGTFYYRVKAKDAAGNVSESSNEAGASVSGDNSAPSVAITAPANNATVAGTVAVTAVASDNGVVAGVQFFLDGNPVGLEDTNSPYSIVWDTSAVPNGLHTLTARARDAAGNQTNSAPVAVNVNNTAPSGLVAAWGFEEGAGTTTTDVSGSNLIGTISGASWSAAGRFGNALSFDGVNDWVTVADNNVLDLTTGMTIEAWVNPTINNGWETILMKETTGELAYALYSDNNGNDSGGPRRPAVWIRQGGTSYGTAGTSQTPVGNWTHIAATYDGSVLRIYENGLLANSLSRIGSINVTGSPLRMGGNSVWSEWFNGLIDEVRIYNRALSAAEIQSDMNTPIGGGGGGVQADAAAPPSTDARTISPADVDVVRSAAIANWASAGADVSALAGVVVHVADLAGAELGYTSNENNEIWLDRDAAGWGWFVDSTPELHEEFEIITSMSVFRAAAGPALGRYDLLTVLSHEFGHLLGYEGDHAHVDASPDHGLMAESLAVEIRTLPTAIDVEIVRAAHDESDDHPEQRTATTLASNVETPFLPIPPLDVGSGSTATADGMLARFDQRPVRADDEAVSGSAALPPQLLLSNWEQRGEPIILFEFSDGWNTVAEEDLDLRNDPGE
jgi:hypothetical protein